MSTRIDLLPSRYRLFRVFSRQLYWGLVGLAALILVLGTLEAGIRAKSAAYEQMARELAPAARPYRTINARFDQLQKAEKVLLERKGKASPLLDRTSSVLPSVTQFTGGVPSGTRLTELSVDLSGKLTVAGEARAYADVSRFVKWVGETLGYEQVALTGVRRMGETKGVEFSLTALKATGGGAQ